MKYLLPMALLMGVLQVASAQQQPHCASDFFEKELFEDQPAARADYMTARQDIHQKAEVSRKSTNATVYTIPVVVHVIYDDYEDNISKAQIEDAIAVLNEDYRRMNADRSATRSIFKPVAADVEIEFKLAKLDPNGNCTDGIVRVQSPLSIDARNNVKPLSHWDNNKYLNIWVVNNIKGNGAGTTLGYAYKPRYNQDYRTDGVLIRHDMMGRIGTATGIGRTLTHEVGHYLGLDHPFYDNPNDPNDTGCDFGDGISDTPPVASASFGCNLNRNSCNNDSPDLPDMIENYMDYADDVCTNLFTKGQKAVMRSSLQTAGLRKSLKDAYNLQNTGVLNLNSCAPEADFEAETRVSCPNEPIKFYDRSSLGEVDSYSWSFPGGSPSSSTQANPTVVYNQGGTYMVSLTVTNSSGSTTIVDSNYIRVSNNYGNNAQWSEDFEGNAFPRNILRKTHNDQIEFELTNAVASQGQQSLVLRNNDENIGAETDELISPSIYTDFGKDMNLVFDYAFALNDYTNEDELNVYASEDCGKTWELRRKLPGVLLNSINGTVDNGNYQPAQGDWKSATVNFDAYQGKGPILIKLEFTSGGGNNFYLDNLRFSSSNIGIEEQQLEGQFSLYPNPADDRFTLELLNPLKRDASVKIMDLRGQVIQEAKLQSGEMKLDLNAGSLSSGVYLLQLQSGNQQASKKLIVR